ncbi:MAG: MltA domain-containing protein [Legionella longbeachae]|nr:MltA domain-containing protein [Legionella longbeachae]
MNSKIIYKIIGTIFITFSLVAPLLYKKVQEPIVPANKESFQIPVFKITTSNTSDKAAVKKEPEKNSISNREISKKPAPKKAKSKKHKTEKVIIKNYSNKLALTKVPFEELPGWDKADVKKSLLAFQLSCKTFLKQKPSHATGSKIIKLKARDWHPACKAALALDSISENNARSFFEKWFHPLELEQKKPVHGLFTGYYMPQLKGSLEKTSTYSTPIYGLPKGKYATYYTREQIDNGVLKKKAAVIAWIHSPAERLFLEIEGSGVIQLTNGEKIYLGYAGENGAKYTSIGKVLIDRGIMTKHNASKAAIMRYLDSHTKQANNLIHKNKSFVFFEILKKPFAVGAQDMALTPGYSLAIDKKWIPLGAPLWLDTKRPDVEQNNEKLFQRLMIAQDTGGAIRGFMRGDIYWGSGKIAAFLGEHMKNEGHYWLLLPKHIFNRLAKKSM